MVKDLLKKEIFDNYSFEMKYIVHEDVFEENLDEEHQINEDERHHHDQSHSFHAYNGGYDNISSLNEGGDSHPSHLPQENSVNVHKKVHT
jgi:hypothetical protein